MRVFLFFLSCLFSFSSIAGSLEDSANVNSINSLYKLDLFRAFQGTLQVSREAVIKKNWTYNIGIMGTYASTRGLAKPYLKAQEFAYADQTNNLLYSLENVELLGYGINIQIKKYLGKFPVPFSGYYAAPELFVRKLNLQSSINDKLTHLPKDVNKKLFLAYLGYMVGYQKIIRDVVCIDTYLGGGLFYSQYDDENGPTRYRNNYQVDFSGLYFNAGISIGVTH